MTTTERSPPRLRTLCFCDWLKSFCSSLKKVPRVVETTGSSFKFSTVMSLALSFKHVSPASSFEKKARGFRRRRRRRERSRMGSHANHANHANLDLRAAPGWSGHPRLYRELLDQAVGKCKTTTGRVEVDSVFTSLMLAAQTQSGGWTVKSFWGF